MSVGPRLSQLQAPALLVHSTLDPMVPPWTYEPHLQRSCPSSRTMRSRAAGTSGFRRTCGWGSGGRGCWRMHQAVAWLLER